MKFISMSTFLILFTLYISCNCGDPNTVITLSNNKLESIKIKLKMNVNNAPEESFTVASQERILNMWASGIRKPASTFLSYIYVYNSADGLVENVSGSALDTRVGAESETDDQLIYILSVQ